MPERFYIETLGCPKNEVDSDKLVGTLLADGLVATDDPARRGPGRRQHLRVHRGRPPGVDRHHPRPGASSAGLARGSSSPAAWPSATGPSWPPPSPRWTPSPVSACRSRSDARRGARRQSPAVPSLDLLNLPRPRLSAPWAYVKIAEGCDRTCGFCAIPSFRGPQRSRDVASIVAEVDQLRVKEIVLVAQDLASYGKDRPDELGAGRDRAARARGGRAGRTDPAAVPLPVGPDRRVDRGHRSERRAVLRPFTAARVQTAAAADAPLGGRRRGSCAASARSGPDSRRPPSGPTSSSATPVRRRRITTSCWRSSRPRSSTGAGSSPTARRTARTRPGSTVPFPGS